MTDADAKVLLIGYGNPGRLDDGLGPAAAKAVERLALPSVDVDSDYQLTVEDAEAAARHEIVILVDAAETGCEPFSLTRLTATRELSFSTHSVRPEAVLGMAATLFGASPAGYLMGVRGYAFNEFREALSEKARENLEQAVAMLAEALAGEDAAAIRHTLDTRLTEAVGQGDQPCKTENT